MVYSREIKRTTTWNENGKILRFYIIREATYLIWEKLRWNGWIKIYYSTKTRENGKGIKYEVI